MSRRRYAVIYGDVSLDEIRRYLPDNYEAVQQSDGVLIQGEDVAGWTLDGYVLPRLASGLLFATEVQR